MKGFFLLLPRVWQERSSRFWSGHGRPLTSVFVCSWLSCVHWKSSLKINAQCRLLGSPPSIVDREQMTVLCQEVARTAKLKQWHKRANTQCVCFFYFEKFVSLFFSILVLLSFSAIVLLLGHSQFFLQRRPSPYWSGIDDQYFFGQIRLLMRRWPLSLSLTGPLTDPGPCWSFLKSFSWFLGKFWNSSRTHKGHLIKNGWLVVEVFGKTLSRQISRRVKKNTPMNDACLAYT